MNSRKINAAIKAYTKVCKHLGIQISGETKETPARVIRALAEMTEGLHHGSVLPFRATSFACNFGPDIVVSINNGFSSLCPHHHMVFFGRCDVGYLPDSKIIGLSKIPRLVGFLSRKPVMQEKLGAEIADKLMEILQPKAVCVRIKARHTCVCARGPFQMENETITCTIRGKEGCGVKDEILKHMGDLT